MKSSYLNKIEYSDLFKLLCFYYKPTNIIEIGILEGYSLEQFINNTENCIIKAYDIFDEFNGNGAKYEIIQKFSDYENVTIDYGDFYKLHKNIDDNSQDIIHIDIANNGDVYEYAIQNYIKKLKKNGILLLEGGSKERDNIEWMIKYNKQKINSIISKYKNNYEIITIGTIPSITIIKNFL